MKLDTVTNNASQEALKMAESGMYSDFTIRCGEKEYLVHKVIICTRSQFFAKALDNPFQESQTGIVDLSDDDPEAVDSMLCYIYNGYFPRSAPGTAPGFVRGDDYEEFWATKDHGDIPVAIGKDFLVLHAKVYAIAEKYAVTGLKELAARYFIGTLRAKSVVADQELADACKIAYTSTIDSDRGLRDPISSFIYYHTPRLDEPSLQELLKSCPDLMYDVIMRHRDATIDKIQSGELVVHYDVWEYEMP